MFPATHACMGKPVTVEMAFNNGAVFSNDALRSPHGESMMGIGLPFWGTNSTSQIDIKLLATGTSFMRTARNCSNRAISQLSLLFSSIVLDERSKVTP